MMDFGFAGLVDKFEDYFGKKVTKGLMILIGAAVASGSISLVFSFIVNPLFQLAMFVADTSPEAYSKYETIAKGALGVLLLIGLGVAVVITYQYKVMMDRLQRLFEEHDVHLNKEMAFLILSAALAYAVEYRKEKTSRTLLKKWVLAAKFLTALEKRRERLKTPKSESPAPQLPQDIETKKMR